MPVKTIQIQMSEEVWEAVNEKKEESSANSWREFIVDLALTDEERIELIGKKHEGGD